MSDEPAGLPGAVDIFDTTLRDGSQFEGISLSVDDKLRVAEQLEWLGVRWIEGGYPQANPKDAEFFRRAPDELKLDTAELVAFGSTRRPRGKVDTDETLAALLGAGTGTVCIVGKSSEFHVTEALRTDLDEGVAMVADSVRFLKNEGLRVFFDAEHFFDGMRQNAEFTLRVLEAAAIAGADCLVLCDTNGGSLPHQVQQATGEVVAAFGSDVQIGIHTQNDTGNAVANSVAAVLAGATQVQGTVNGYGERTGNANLMTVVPNLELKLGVQCVPEGHLERLTSVSRHVAELVNLPPHPADPYVGASAFAHKGGLHTSALGRVGGASYEHVEPAVVGNTTRVLISDLGGKAGMAMKAEQLGVHLDSRAAGALNEELKRREAAGFVYEAADASLELLMRNATGWRQPYFRTEGYRVTTYHRLPSAAGVDPGTSDQDVSVECEATVKIWISDERFSSVGEGNGPVNALDNALRSAIRNHYPVVDELLLIDFKVRVLDSSSGTGAVTRVLIDSTDGMRNWSTIGVSENVIEASWQALADAFVWLLVHTS